MRHQATEKGVKEAEFAKHDVSLDHHSYPDDADVARSLGAIQLRGKPDFRQRVQFWLERVWIHIQDQWRRDCETNSALLLWSAFLLALGAASYSVLPDEPVWWLLALLTGSGVLLAYLKARRGLSFSAPIMLVSFLSGLSVASLHGQFFATPVLKQELSAKFTGRLETIEYRGSDQRWTIAVNSIEGLAAVDTPRKLLLLRRAKGETYRAGDQIEAWARLTPLQRQVFPGAFDYGRYLWSRQIGGQGYLGKRIRLVSTQSALMGVSLWQIGRAQIDRIRADVALYLSKIMSADAAGLAAALAVGKRDYLTSNSKDALRLSGLAHILAISGLHMALVTLTIFGGVRLLASFIEPLVLRFDTKKLAAGAALIVASSYLLLSGSGVATIRAYVMMAIFLGAILAGRPALTMHNVALALIILVLSQPYAVVEPGLQMSFAATVALVAGYRRLEQNPFWRGMIGRNGNLGGDGPNGRPRRGNGAFIRSLLFLGRWFLGLMATALLAGLATLPFSIAFFNQMAPMGLLANLLAMPILSLTVMPAALLSVLAVPLGLQQWPLLVMEWGLEQIVVVAQWVVELSPQAALLAVGPPGLALISAALLACFAIHPNRLALGACAISVIGLVGFSQTQQEPDIWIAENGKGMAARGEDGRWNLIGIKSDRFLAQALLKADGDSRALPLVAQSQGAQAIHPQKDVAGARCDSHACRLTLILSGDRGGSQGSKQVWRLSLVKSVKAFAEECARADILVSSLKRPDNCKGPLQIFDRDILKRNGSHFVWLPRLEDVRGEPKQLVGNVYDKREVVRDIQQKQTESERILLSLNRAQPLYDQAVEASQGWLAWPSREGGVPRRVPHLPTEAAGQIKMESVQPYAGRAWHVPISEIDERR